MKEQLSKDKTYKKPAVLVVCAVLAVITIIAYEPLRHNGFVGYDDDEYVLDCPQVRQGLTLETLKWAFAEPHFHNWHPITTLNYLIEYEFFGINAFGYHLTSLLLHIINSLLMLMILKKMTGAFWPSVFAAAVFAVHPLQVESVAWVAEQKNVISGLFWLLTIAAYIRYAEKPAAGRYIVLLLVYGLCLMTKAIVVVVPFVLLLLDFWPLRRITRNTMGRIIIEKIPLLISAVLLIVVTTLAQKSGGAIKTMPYFAFQYRLENAIVSYARYPVMMVYPVNLAVFYPHPGPKIALWQPLLAMLTLAVITGLVFYFGRQRRYLITGWLWYVGTLVPVIGLIQLGGQAMADRYMYLPMVGLLIIIAELLSEAAQKWRNSRYVLFVISGVIFIVLIIVTRNQVRYWKDDFTLFGHAIDVTKNNENMHYNIGHAYQQKGQFEKAMEHYKEALRIEPGDLQAMNNLGVLLLSQKKTDEALKIFEKAVQLNSRYIDSINNLGLALREKGRVKEAMEKWQQVLDLEPMQPEAHYNIGVTMLRNGGYSQAVEHLRKALEKKRNWVEVYNYLGTAYMAIGQFKAAMDSYNEAIKLKPNDINIESNIALTLAKLGKTEEANQIWQRILARDPENFKAHYGLGRLLADKKQLDEAMEHFNKVLQAKPDWFEIHLMIADVYYKRKELTLAVQHLREAVRLKNDCSEAMNLLAWIEATAKDISIRNSDEAVRFASSACELTANKNPVLLDTLAVAYASAGRFNDAIKTAQTAVKLADEHKLTKLANEISEHLKLFKAKQTYYEK
ncbi:MAG: tetratricopeptide repeat protein [Sedimentisphaerales bacterium]